MDIENYRTTVIIGTLFKEMLNKPSILDDIVGVLGTKKESNLTADGDYMILEDSSGRIRIKKSSEGEPIHDSQFVSGSIIALKGISDRNGYFEI